jgi:hypothetical protein
MLLGRRPNCGLEQVGISYYAARKTPFNITAANKERERVNNMFSMKVLVPVMALALCSSVALAEETQTEFYSPMARAVMFVGGDDVKVCSFNRDWPTPRFVCVDKPYTGDFEAPWMSNIVEGPVRVIGAEWAFYLPVCEDIGAEASFQVEGKIELCHWTGKSKGYLDMEGSGYASGNTCPGWVEMQAREMPAD